MNKQICIVGGGPGGLAAALAAKKEADCEVVVLERDLKLGGILNQCIHDGFGLHRFGKMMSGPEYAHRYAEMVREAGITVLTDTMVTDIAPDRTLTAVNKTGALQFKPDALILATGCRERTRGAIAIPGSRPAGVFTAGVVQNLMNMHNLRCGSRVVILGSGDIGLIMARRMTYEGVKVLAVVELMKQPGGLQRNISQCLYDFDIPLYTSHTITEIRGKKRVSSVVMAAVGEDGAPIAGTEQEIECDALVLSVGLIPENELAQKAGVDLNTRTNGVLVDQYLQS
ncbi:MAG: FAD-dependent oxidoreductase, partial [Clostridia bacterium]|nr:FAD-dependent oxidoreductase [Clostridia bacterium]